MKKFLKIFLILFIFFVVIAPLVSFTYFSVLGTSMEPTLKNGDKIIVFKFAYSF